MNEKNRIERKMAEVLGLCYEISVNSEADCFFTYSPHVNGFDVVFHERGWKEDRDGEWLAMCKELTCDNLIAVLDKLYELKVDLGGEM